MPTKSPSPYTSLKRLLEIRKDNYVGAGGVDYVAEEVDFLITQKQQRRGLLEAEEARHTERAHAALHASWIDSDADTLLEFITHSLDLESLPAPVLRSIIRLQAKKLQTTNAVPF